MRNLEKSANNKTHKSFSEGLLNLDKPLNINSLEIIRKINEKITRKTIFSNTFLDKMTSGCLILFFQKSRFILSFLMKGVIKLISVVKLDDEKKFQKNFFSNYFKKNFYRSNIYLSNRNTIKYTNTKCFLAYDFKTRTGLIKYIFESSEKIDLSFLKLGFGLILRKNCSIIENRQIKVGILTENDNLIIFQDFIDILWSRSFWGNLLLIKNLMVPIQVVLKNLKKITVKNSTINSLCYGSNLITSGILAIEENIQKEEEVLLITQKKELVALGKMNYNSESIFKNSKGVVVRLEKVLMKKNQYPKNWGLGLNSVIKKIEGSLKTLLKIYV